jgi:hypothetical protein
MATTTPNFGWSVPTSTDYVKDGATAIETLGDAIDARFGNVGTYPNQIVNVVSGVSRPLPYAMQVGTGTIASSANPYNSVTITFAVSTRFTQTPILFTQAGYNAAFGWIVIPGNASTTGFTAYGERVNGGAFSSSSVFGYVGIQMTSAASAG